MCLDVYLLSLCARIGWCLPPGFAHGMTIFFTAGVKVVDFLGEGVAVTKKLLEPSKNLDPVLRGVGATRISPLYSEKVGT